MPSLKEMRTLMSQNRNLESGNVFIFILLGVVLFAALSFSIARGFRSNTTSMMSEREADLAATDILNYAQRIGRAVDRLRRKGVSESDISFDQSFVAGYNHTPAQPDNRKIFHPDGGNIKYLTPSNDWLDSSQSAAASYGTWYFTGQMRVVDVGKPSGQELTIAIPYVSEKICRIINKKLGFPTINQDISDTTDYADGNKYKGSFGSEVLQNHDGRTSGCYEGDVTPATGTYHFYHVLIAR